MKITIDRAALMRSLNHVQSAVERRTTIPILSNVLLRAEDGELSLSTTDMDLEINETVAANVERAGATTAPASGLPLSRSEPTRGRACYRRVLVWMRELTRLIAVFWYRRAQAVGVAEVRFSK